MILPFNSYCQLKRKTFVQGPKQIAKMRNQGNRAKQVTGHLFQTVILKTATKVNAKD